MTILGGTLLVLVLGFVALVVGMQVVIQAQARALAGRPVPPLPGPLGEEVTRSPRALVYFFSPMCGACRTITPRVRALREKNPSVFSVDVSESMELARALKIMATPSTVEIADGKVVGVHIGPIPAEVVARFS